MKTPEDRKKYIFIGQTAQNMQFGAEVIWPKC